MSAHSQLIPSARTAPLTVKNVGFLVNHLGVCPSIQFPVGSAFPESGLNDGGIRGHGDRVG